MNKNTINLSKKCKTSVRVLQTLLFLTQNNEASIPDILNYFKSSQEEIYTNEVILKYLNTLKVFGLNPVKVKNKYTLSCEIPQISLNKNEIEGLKILSKLAESFPEKETTNNFNDFITRLLKRFDLNTGNTFRNTNVNICQSDYNCFEKYQNLINDIEKYCKDKQKLKITYKFKISQNTITVSPLEFKYNEGDIYFSCYNPTMGHIVDLNLKDIISIEQLPTVVNCEHLLVNSVSFKLKDRLAKTYKLKKGEKLTEILPNGDIIISNNADDRTLLISRLSRYGAYCEVVSPLSFREDMKNFIDSTLKLYL